MLATAPFNVKAVHFECTRCQRFYRVIDRKYKVLANVTKLIGKPEGNNLIEDEE